MKKYFLYADIYRAKITDRQIREYFKMAMEDVGIDHMYLDKHQGSGTDENNPTSIEVKQEIFGSEKGRGYLYVFKTDKELTSSQILLIKNSLVMNIMGVVDIKSFDSLNDFTYKVRFLKKFVKNNDYSVRDLERKAPKIKFLDFEKDYSLSQVLQIIDPKRSYGRYGLEYQIDTYFKVKRAELKLQELLCSI